MFNPSRYTRLPHALVGGFEFACNPEITDEEREFVLTAIADGLEQIARHEQTGGKLTSAEAPNAAFLVPVI